MTDFDFCTTQQILKRLADNLQEKAVHDKNPLQKPVRTKAVQSLLRLAQSSVMRKLAEYGD